MSSNAKAKINLDKGKVYREREELSTDGPGGAYLSIGIRNGTKAISTQDQWHLSREITTMMPSPPLSRNWDWVLTSSRSVANAIRFLAAGADGAAHANRDLEHRCVDFVNRELQCNVAGVNDAVQSAREEIGSAVQNEMASLHATVSSFLRQQQLRQRDHDGLRDQLRFDGCPITETTKQLYLHSALKRLR